MERLLRRVAFGIVGLLVVVLAAATLLGRFYGQSSVLSGIYHAWWFIFLWALLAVAAMVYILCVKGRLSLLLLHASFVVVLLGAFVSFLTSRHGTIELAQEGAPASMFTTTDGALEKLPFRLQLEAVDTVASMNGGQPAGYIARITVDDKEQIIAHTLSLNNPVSIKEYQFCIKGMVDGGLSLLVTYDVCGRPISYVGYAMVFFSFLLLFFDRRSGFNTLLQKLRGSRFPKSSAIKADGDVSLSRLAKKMFVVMLCLLVLWCLLWYWRGVFPATNGAEALILLAIFVALFAVVLKSKKEFALLSRVLVVAAGLIAIVAGCSLDGYGGVQPILRTPLLGVHVTTIIIAYALLACTAVNAVIALCVKDKKRMESQALLGRVLLYPATMLLAAGIFIGAVWANFSWGRYWGWDPKEVWALITLLVCSVAFHTRSLSFIAKPKAFHIFCIVAFVAVLFTFFGVNYLLGGLHSYA